MTKNMFLLHLRFLKNPIMPKCQLTGVVSLMGICHCPETEILFGMSKCGAVQSKTGKDSIFLK